MEAEKEFITKSLISFLYSFHFELPLIFIIIFTMKKDFSYLYEKLVNIVDNG